MKVNTDGVLLGAVMTVLPQDNYLLDIGTGTGCIALMAAQRLSEARQNNGQNQVASREVSENLPADYQITAIDIDEASAREAADNFADSPWAEHLGAEHISLSDFTAEACEYDVIFSNPPYFESALKAPDPRKRTAKHAGQMSYREIISFSSRHLTARGRLSMILPAETEKDAVRYAALFALKLCRIVKIRTTPQKPVSRIIVEFVNSRELLRSGDQSEAAGKSLISEELTIQKDEGGYSDEYRSLVEDFLFI